MLRTLDDAREQWLEQPTCTSKISNFSSSSSSTAIVPPPPPVPAPARAPTQKQRQQQHQKEPAQLSKRSREPSIDKPKQCHSCQSTETPEWRKGPMGPRTLCNACGLIWAKLARQQGHPEAQDEIDSNSNENSQELQTSSDDAAANKYALSYLLS
ncbi:hypothetical protein BDB00DRAFT_266844 [Zychaea mexicana]|uniref:uncharacterized protein n=1 Tax=Zychaea mexicana TaxID=64656 RepID=UPI0022FED204|nr:uncharacterized protein BDB00DRAFT_266844 [Zychaea mexicana]KAI9495025.1 hypothetical protein BDB00DRAFT_266844 [Zychaea mexicana]